MPSISEIQSDVDAAIESPEEQQSPVGAVAPDVPPESGDAALEPGRLPDICNLEWQREGMPDTEFNRKYPPDPWGEEMGPNARVWKIYRDQSDLSHKSMLESWNKTLDVLLIFAGLFSAVLTAFLIESYKALQPDYTQYMAAFLYAAAVSHNHTGGILPTLDSIVAPDRFIQTSVTQRWTNGFWFSSLVISLAVALLCILVKQWLDAYDSHVSAAAPSPIHWARRHSLYHHGLKEWGVPMLISFLPLLLHLSLFLFFIGLVLFLHPLDGAISYSLLVMVSSVAAFYTLSLVLPAWRVECPSYTPLLERGLRAVSRAISGLLYFIRPLEDFASFPRRSALFALARHAQQWLESIQLRAGLQPMRETVIISQYDRELDGYTLSTLIHLPTDAHRDVVNTAFAAIGAVTSTRTIKAIRGQVLNHVFNEKLQHCFDNITLTETGFTLTSYAQLRRAQVVTRVGSTLHARFVSDPVTAPDLCWFLGIDGALLEVLDYEARQSWVSSTYSLIRGLESLPMDGDRSRGFPLRSTCLIFLEDYFRLLQYRDQDPQRLCTLLLVFCAGRFACADMDELVRAVRSMETALKTQCNINIPVHNSGKPDYICAVVNGLWTMLADFETYRVNPLTARTVAHQAIACFTRVASPDFSFTWAQLSGLSTFIRSPTFGKCVPAGDSLDVVNSLDNYILTFRDMWTLSRTAVPLDYWECIATLFKMGPDRMVLRCYRFSTLNEWPWDFFPVERSDSWLDRGSPYATQDDWFEQALVAFLDGPNAISTWTGASEQGRTSIQELASLAHRIAIVLCRRQRLGRPNDSFVRGFFSGSFLFARFRDLAYVEYDKYLTEQSLLGLAKHCLHLSPERFIAIIAQLEETGEVGSELRARTVAFAQRLRNGIMPEGDLSRECAEECPCVIRSARADVEVERGWGDVWTGLVTRFLRGRTDSGIPDHV